VFGGSDTNNKAVARVQVYNTDQHKRTLLHDKMFPDKMRAVLWETIQLNHETCFIYNVETKMWQERASFNTDVISFCFVIGNQKLYSAGDGSYSFTVVMYSVWVSDVMEDPQGVGCPHHATLLRCSAMCTFSFTPLYGTSI
jgi:hypothetical protein